MKKNKKNSVDMSTISTESLKNELFTRLGSADEFLQNCPNKTVKVDNVDLATALANYDPLSEVVTSDILLDLQMFIGLAKDEDAITEKGNIKYTPSDAKMVPYIFGINKSGQFKSIKVTPKDWEILNTMKYRAITIGLPSNVYGLGNNYKGLGDLKDFKADTSKEADEELRKMFIAAKKRKDALIKPEEEYSEVYSHTQDEARKAIGIKKPNIFKRIWSKITGKPILTLSAAVKKYNDKQNKINSKNQSNSPKFPESIAGSSIADKVFTNSRIDLEVLESKYNKDYLGKLAEFQNMLNLQ